MRKFISKILSTPNNVVKVGSDSLAQAEILKIGAKAQRNINHLFGGSLAIRLVSAGSDNAVEQELNALSNNYYDVARFGINFVASPRHADMLLVTGPVTRNMRTALERTYQATPTPKIVVAVGDDAIDGGLFRGSYVVLDGASAVIPVDYTIAGDPPSPLAILVGLLSILETISEKKGKQ